MVSVKLDIAETTLEVDLFSTDREHWEPSLGPISFLRSSRALSKHLVQRIIITAKFQDLKLESSNALDN